MNKQIEGVPSDKSAGEILLNGTFLVRPVLGLTTVKPLKAEDSPLDVAEGRLEGPESNSASSTRLEVVPDGSNLLPFHFLRAGDRLGRAVLKLQREDGSTGTGFLVASDILLTNHHILFDEATAATCVALANYEVSPPHDPAGRPAVSLLDPASMFVTNAELDFTFCGVRGLEFLGVVPLDRERMHIAAAETVTIIQHPAGRPKEISLRDNRVVRADAIVVQYACDTEPGSSGSPVFNDQWKPVAIHHASVLTDSPDGRRVGGGSRARYHAGGP
jgi:endonuclease G